MIRPGLLIVPKRFKPLNDLKGFVWRRAKKSVRKRGWFAFIIWSQSVEVGFALCTCTAKRSTPVITHATKFGAPRRTHQGLSDHEILFSTQNSNQPQTSLEVRNNELIDIVQWSTLVGGFFALLPVASSNLVGYHRQRFDFSYNLDHGRLAPTLWKMSAPCVLHTRYQATSPRQSNYKCFDPRHRLESMAEISLPKTLTNNQPTNRPPPALYQNPWQTTWSYTHSTKKTQ